ncbi:MAG: AAA family ATPase [Bacteroidales bacterium]
MELLYLWVENYKNIKRQGFNFSSKYKFDYDPDKNKITVEENKNHIEGFFGEHILNITAVVGENGSGKSTLCQILYGVPDLELFYIASKNANGVTYLNCYYNGFNKPLITLLFHSVNCKIGLIEEMKPVKVVYIESTMVLYSPVFSVEYAIDGRGSGEPDISTNSLFYRANSKLNKFLNEETYRQIDFLVQSDYKKANIRIPKSIKFWGKHENSDEIEYSNGNVVELIDNRILEFLKATRTEEIWLNQTSVQNNFYYAFFMFLLIEIGKTENGKLPFDKYIIQEKFTLGDYNYIIESNNKSLRNSIFNFFERYKKHLRSIKKSAFDNYVLNVRELFEIIDKYSLDYHGSNAWYNNHLNSQNYRGRYIEIPEEQLKDLTTFNKEFLDRYKKTKLNFIDFEWTGLSSGELANLNLLARFHSIREKVTNQLLIIIDEGELYLHPKWQKEFINNLISGLNVIFKGKKIQLIFTSHSPYIVSDLPKDNIIFLKRGTEKDKPIDKDISAEGNCIVVKGDELRNMERTFGANIHTLLTDSFFMEGGLIGEFAKKKIEEVISTIKDKQTEKKDEIVKIINLIGDELIKKRLKDMYDEAFGKVESYESDKEYLQWLQDEMNRVKLKNSK